MALEGNLTYLVTEEVINKISNFTHYLEAIGILVLGYLVFNIINMIINRKKRNELKKINENLEDIKKLLSKQKR